MNYNKSTHSRPQSGSPKTPRKHNIGLTATVSARSFGASYMGCNYDSNHHDHITFLEFTLTSDHTTDQCYTEAEIQPCQHRKRYICSWTITTAASTGTSSTTWNLQSNSNTNRAKHGAQRNFNTWQHPLVLTPQLHSTQGGTVTDSTQHAGWPQGRTTLQSWPEGHVSAARFGIMKIRNVAAEPLDPDDPRIKCSRCQAAGTSDHQLWTCRGNTPPRQPPTGQLQRRLGWPTTAKTTEERDYNQIVFST